MNQEKLIKSSGHQARLQIEFIKSQYKRHKKAIRQAFLFFDCKDSNSFHVKKVKINGVECICTHADIRHAPVFSCRFEFMPIRSDYDAGNGMGCMVTKDFMENKGG